jgi:Ca2+-binding RTX toxin-like protein
LRGNGGQDLIEGNDGNDNVFGNKAKDRMFGQAGGDFFNSKDGVADRVVGGLGSDEALTDGIDDVSGVENEHH